MILILTFIVLILSIGMVSAENHDLSEDLSDSSNDNLVLDSNSSNNLDDSNNVNDEILDFDTDLNEGPKGYKNMNMASPFGDDSDSGNESADSDNTDDGDGDDNNGSETGVITPDLNDTIDDDDGDTTPGRLYGKTYIDILNDAFDPSEIGYLPVTYDLRDYGWVTPVKDQSSSGSCWAFASTAALESYLLKTEGIEYDFSENNMKNIMGSYSINGTDYGPNDGGNEVLILAYLLRWSGAINETDDPYNASSIRSAYNLTRVKYVQDVLFIPKRGTATDNDQIKWALMNYGALYTGIYWDSSYEKGETYYYYGTYPYGNHAITIVGWDDTYSASNFKYKPAGDGAFIIKNSWGTESYGNPVGNEGYYYISYYDNVFAGRGSNEYFSAMAFTNVENTSYYKSNYYYDVYGNTFDAIGYKNDTAWFANQFTADSNNPLKAIGFFSYGTSSYTANIYVNNSLRYTQSGNVNGAGYHTVKLDELVDLHVGDLFKIAVKLITPNCDYPIAIENYHSGFTTKANANANQSFVSSNGKVWQDLTTISGYAKANVCLKAYTAYAADLIMDITSNVSYYSKGDEIELTINVTNNGDLTSADICSQLDENVRIVSYETTSGTFDPNSKIWSLTDLYEQSSNVLKIIIQINTKQANITNNFFVNSSIYNVNRNSSSLELFKRVNANLTSDALYTSYNSGELFDVTIVDEDREALNDVEVCFRVYDENNVLIGTYFNTTDANGKVYLISNFNAGSYLVNISLVNPYYEGEVIGEIIVSKSNTQLEAINAESILNKTATFKALVNNGAKIVNEGSVKFYVNGIFIGISNVYDGVAVLEYVHNKVGTFEISAEYVENSNYHSSSDSSSLNVKKITANIQSNDENSYYNDFENFNITVLDENYNGVGKLKIQFNIYQNGIMLVNNFIITDSDGIAKLPLNLTTGNYTIEADILDDEYLGHSENTITINRATGKLIGQQIGTVYGKSKLLISFNQALTNKAYSNQKVLANFSNGDIYCLITDEEGKATLDLDFQPGYYTYQLSSANNNIIGKSAGEIIINKEKATIISSSISKYYLENAQLTARLLDQNGNPIANKNIGFTLNGKTTNVSTNEKGEAVFKINLLPGTYSISIGIEDDLLYCDDKIVAATVLDIPTKIIASDLNKYYNNKSQLQMTLKDHNGKALANKKVTFNINGKQYTKTTNVKGIAVISISLKKGTYKAKISFSEKNYKASTKAVTVKVLNPKIKIARKTVQKGKKLTVIFKDANNKAIKKQKVTVKIGSKKYTKTTNAKGKVSIKITLKKGKYTVKAGFARNGIYGTATYKAKITVK